MQPAQATKLRRIVGLPAALAVLSALAIQFACNPASVAGVELTEASGIYFDRDTIWIVSDDVPGSVFVFPCRNPFPSGVIPIDTAGLVRHQVPGAEFVSDLESIDRLTDGRFVVLSEDLHALFVIDDEKSPRRCDIVAQFDQTVTELGNRGLEGVAIKPLGGGRSLVAVAWEGGFPEYFSIPPQLRQAIGRMPLEPVVIIDTLPATGSAGYLARPAQYLTLETPRYDSTATLEQRFRITDLVWHSWSTDSGAVEGMIALLSSASSPLPESRERRRFQHKYLLRYDLSGHPVGAPCDVTPLVKERWEMFEQNEMKSLPGPLLAHARAFGEKAAGADWENVNWEGLGWFKTGESLILIYDGNPLDPPFAFVIPIPADWK